MFKVLRLCHQVREQEEASTKREGGASPQAQHRHGPSTQDMMEKIDQQVKANIKAQKEKKTAKPEYVGLTKRDWMMPIQEVLYDNLQEFGKKLESIDQTQQDFMQEVNEIEADLTKTALEKAGKNPGIAMRNLLQKWANEPVHTKKELDEYRNELWLSLQEFEEQLRDQQYGLELELRNANMRYRTRVDSIRSQTSMRIEALESALIETKIKYARQLERSEMQMAEMESKLLNQHVTAEDKMTARVEEVMDNLKKQKEIGLDPERQVKLYEICVETLHKQIVSLTNTLTLKDKTISELQFEINKNTEFNEQAQKSVQEAKDMVLYYQISIFEMLRNTGLFEEDGSGRESSLSEDVRIQFKEIMELNEERLRKDEEDAKLMAVPDPKRKLARLNKFVQDFHEIMVMIDFRGVFANYQTVVDQKEKVVHAVADEFVKMGIFPGLSVRRHGTEMFTSRQLAEIQAAGGEGSNTQLFRQKTDLGSHGSPGRKQSRKVQRQASTDENMSPTSLERLGLPGNQSLNHSSSGQYKDQELNNRLRSMDNERLREVQKLVEHLVQPLKHQVTRRLRKKEDDFGTDSDMSSDLESLNLKIAKKGYTKDARKTAQKQYNFGMDLLSLERQSVAHLSTTSLTSQLKANQSKRREEAERRERKAARKNAASPRGGRSQFRKNQGGSPAKRATSSQRKRQDGNFLTVSTSKAGMEKQGSKVSVGNLLSNDEHSDDESVSIQSSAGKIINLQKTGGSTSKESVNADSKTKSKETSKSPDAGGKAAKSKASTRNASPKVSKKNVVPSKTLQKGASNKPDDKKVSAKALLSKKTTMKSQKKPEISVSYTAGSESKRGREDDDDGFNSDHMTTEPLDQMKEVLDEIESKLLDKYQMEIEETGAAPDNSFKLKARQNDELFQVFKQSLGKELTSKEMNQLTMIGTIDDYVAKVNELQVRHLRTDQPPDAAAFLRPKKKKTIDFDREIPMTDCIMADLDHDGQLLGYRIRPEIAKMIMWREDGDLTLLYKVIKTCNYMNRLLLDHQQDYMLGTKRRPVNVQKVDFGCMVDTYEPEVVEKVRGSWQKSSGKRQTESEEDEEEESEASNQKGGMSEDMAAFFSMLKSHCMAILTRASTSQRVFYRAVMDDWTFEDMLKYRMPNIFPELSEEQRINGIEVDSSRAMTFHRYCEILLGLLETKLKTLIPREDLKELSIQQLVYIGDLDEEGSGDLRHTGHRGTQTDKLRESVQSKKSRQTSSPTQVVVEAPPRLKQLMDSPKPSKRVVAQRITDSPYSQRNLAKVKPHKESQTDAYLLDGLLQDRKESVSVGLAQKQIDRAVGDEMKKTIATLNEFVNAVSLSSKIVEQKTSKRRSPAQALFQEGRKSETTHLSAGSPVGSHHLLQPIDPKEQLMQLRNTIQERTASMQHEIADHTAMIEQKQMALRTAEFKSRPHVQSKKQNSINMNVMTLNSRLPQLANANQTAHHERNHSVSTATASTTQRNTMYPSLYNSSSKPTTIIKNPFKQVHKAKDSVSVFTTDSSVARFAHGTHRSQDRPGSGRNPPGLIAKRIINVPTREDEILVKTLNTSSIVDSKDFQPVVLNQRSRQDAHFMTMSNQAYPRPSAHMNIEVLKSNNKRDAQAQATETAESERHMFSPGRKSEEISMNLKRGNQEQTPGVQGHLRVSRNFETASQALHNSLVTTPQSLQRRFQNQKSFKEAKQAFTTAQGTRKMISVQPLKADSPLRVRPENSTRLNDHAAKEMASGELSPGKKERRQLYFDVQTGASSPR